MKFFVNRFVKNREVTVVIFLLILFSLVGLKNPAFVSPGNLMLTLKGSVMYIALAIGMAFVILTKEIDVSVGSILGMSAAVAATMLRNGSGLFSIIVVTLMVGIVSGLVNGIGVTKFKIPSIVMTLGTNGILRGLMFIYTGGKWVENLPDYFKQASQKSIFGNMNSFVFFTFIIMIIIHLYLTKARNGKYFAAVGDNLEGANLVGIKVNFMKILAFVLSGVFASIAGMVYVSQVGFVGNVAGNGAEMTAIASCVLGGVSLNGGVGSVLGATFGAIIMNSINTALVFLKVPAYWNNTISGLLLIVIVSSDALISRYLVNSAIKQRLSVKTESNGDGKKEEIGGEINEQI
ncbi:MAG: hypothetical protein M0Q14_06135 [Tissierellaceae bacterium]|nr:hypothetical protein [Tissierellaceae bacterium]